MRQKQEQQHKSTLQVFLITQIACFGGFLYGYVISELTIVYDQLAIAFGVDKYKNNNIFHDETPDSYTSEFHNLKTICTVFMPIGALVSSYIGKFIINKMGRRQYMMLGDFIMIAGCAIAMISNLYSFLVARFILGYAVGMNTAIVPLYVKEMSPVSISGLTGSIFQININLGIILSICISLGLNQVVSNSTPVQGIWRLIIVFPAIFSTLRLLGLIFYSRTDTPFYYFQRGMVDQGTEVLKTIYKEEYVEEIKQTMTQTNNSDDSVQDQNQEKDTASYKRRLLVGVCIQFFSQMTGINAVIQFSNNIFGLVTSNYTTINYLTLSSNIFLMFAAFLGSSLSVKFGRKLILQGGYLSCSVLLLTFGIIAFFDVKNFVGLQVVSIVIIFIFYACFNCSIGPVTWIFNSDIVKEEGMSYGVLSNWFGNIVSTLINLNSLIQINFLVFGGFSTAGLLFITKFVLETKDKTYPEIQRLYEVSKNGEKQELLDY
ncbi:hypothetical protein ABPG72_003801 [Tetrahymena utriculariae]